VASGEATPSTAWNAGRTHAARIAAKLEQAGLLVNRASNFAALALPTAVLGAVLTLGVIKLLVGLNRGKPIGFLVLLIAATAMTMIFFGRKPWRTQQGDNVLSKLRKENKKLKKAPESEAQLLMQWSLYDASAMLLAGGAAASLYEWIKPKTSGNGSSWGGCGTACGGGGGCGGCS